MMLTAASGTGLLLDHVGNYGDVPPNRENARFGGHIRRAQRPQPYRIRLAPLLLRTVRVWLVPLPCRAYME